MKKILSIFLKNFFFSLICIWDDINIWLNCRSTVICEIHIYRNIQSNFISVQLSTENFIKQSANVPLWSREYTTVLWRAIYLCNQLTQNVYRIQCLLSVKKKNICSLLNICITVMFLIFKRTLIQVDFEFSFQNKTFLLYWFKKFIKNILS